MLSFNINPVSLIKSMSMALELAVTGINTHQWRTATLCQSLADTMDMKLVDKQNMLCAALLHNIGAASDFAERQRLTDPTQPMSKDVFLHAEEGYHLLRDSLCFKEAAETVRFHHDSWEGGNPSGLSGDRIPISSRIICLATRVEIMIDPAKSILAQRGDIRKIICQDSACSYDPMVVDAFCQCAQKDSFWLDMVNPRYPNVFFQGMESWGQARYSAQEMLSIATMYAKIIDRMSIFTATHSRSVSQVAVLLAKQHGFCEMELFMMEVAGLLYDLGKLSIPNHILEKTSTLTDDEMQIIRQHPYYTFRVLEQLDTIGILASWAAFHHETLDGQGYPFALNTLMLPLGSRIMTVADIFVALAEDRPYRSRMQRHDIERIMRELARQRKIDFNIIEDMFDLYHEADQIVRNNAQAASEPKNAA